MGKMAFSLLVFAFTSWTLLYCASFQCVLGAVEKLMAPCPWTSLAADPASPQLKQLLTVGDRLGAEVLEWLSDFCCNGWADYGCIPLPLPLRYNRGVKQASRGCFCGMSFEISEVSCYFLGPGLSAVILQKLPPALKSCCPPQQLNLWYLLPLWNLCLSDFLGEKFEDWERTLKINPFSGSSSSCLMTFSLCDACVLFMSTWLLISSKKKKTGGGGKITLLRLKCN